MQLAAINSSDFAEIIISISNEAGGKAGERSALTRFVAKLGWLPA
jgi:hypothetical protein